MTWIIAIPVVVLVVVAGVVYIWITLKKSMK